MAWSLGHTLICVLALLLGLLLGWLQWGRRTPSASEFTVAQSATSQPGATSAAAVPVAPAGEPVAAADTLDDTSRARTPATAEAASSAEISASVESSTLEPAPQPASIRGYATSSTTGTPSVAASSVTGDAPDDAPSRPTPLATPDQEVAVSGQNDVASTADAVKSVPVRGPADDLRRISGVGPKMVVALNAADIRTFKQLADADESTLRAALRSAGLRVSPTLPTWPQQARDLLDGGPDGATSSATPIPVAGDAVSA